MPMGGLLTGGIISGVGSLLGGIFGGNAQAEAMKEYVQSLNQAKSYLEGTQQKALNYFDPYTQAGTAATGTLSEMLATPGEGLLANFGQNFQAPTAAQAAQTPGYQFQLKQGLDALQNSAAARGGLLSGGTLAAMNNYAQGTASENYQNTFQNALTQYQQAYQKFLNNQASNYGMLAGQSAQGLQAAQGGAGTIVGIGQDIAGLYGAQGQARAAGIIGQANAYGSILPGIGNSISNIGLLNTLSQMNPYNVGGTAGTPSTFPMTMDPSVMGGQPAAPYANVALPE